MVTTIYLVAVGIIYVRTISDVVVEDLCCGVEGDNWFHLWRIEGKWYQVQ